MAVKIYKPEPVEPPNSFESYFLMLPPHEREYAFALAAALRDSENAVVPDPAQWGIAFHRSLEIGGVVRHYGRLAR